MYQADQERLEFGELREIQIEAPLCTRQIIRDFSDIGSKVFFIISIITMILTIIRAMKNKKKPDEEKKSLKEGIFITISFIICFMITTLLNCFTTFADFTEESISEKPIIYLYPKVETEIEVKLSKKDNITCSYPKYEDGWKVIAQPNGNLKYRENGRNLYALYYEAEIDKKIKVEKEGFVIKGEDSAKFLEEKLEILGLNEKEAEEFIIYWLPKLERNKYNYIRFMEKEEIEEAMPLEIAPKPETTIRVLMTFKGLNKEIKVEEQQLTKVERKGYTAVEWGGSEIK